MLRTTLRTIGTTEETSKQKILTLRRNAALGYYYGGGARVPEEWKGKGLWLLNKSQKEFVEGNPLDWAGLQDMLSRLTRSWSKCFPIVNGLYHGEDDQPTEARLKQLESDAEYVACYLSGVLASLGSEVKSSSLFLYADLHIVSDTARQLSEALQPAEEDPLP